MSVIPCGINQPLAEVLCWHHQQAAQVVQANTENRPGNLLVLQDGVIHQEIMYSHGYRLYRQWNVLVDIKPLCHHGGDAPYGWGRGAVHGVLVTSLYPDLGLYDQRQIGSKEGIHCGLRIGLPLEPVLL